MTPYAVLLVKPSDTDEVIRKSYHALAKEAHPDATQLKPRDRWFEITEAYTAIKTREKRDAWTKRQLLLSGGCETCDGGGVRGTRLFKGKITACGDCGGEGRR